MRPDSTQARRNRTRNLLSQWSTVGLLAILIVAAALGLYGRFAGLGRWPFGVDEFFTSRSVDNILRTGLPRFLCGGFYTRGLTYQYLVALVRLSGLSPEFSGRLVSAVSSLLGLPAAYLIGRRLAGRTLGLVMLIVLSVSVWEIETARFARMYAPFQSIFLWYLVYFVRYTVDRNKAALVPMVALSVLGVLTWEGGALLGVANLLPPLLDHQRGRLRRGSGIYLLGMGLLLVALAAATTDLRGSALPPPAGVEAATASVGEAATAQSLGLYAHYIGWMVVFIAVPMALAVRALPWLWSLRDRWLAATGLTVVLTSALLHQFALCGVSLAVVLLVRLAPPEELSERAARPYLLALAACAIFWPVFGIATGVWQDTSSGAAALTHPWLGLVQHLGGFPDVFDEILRPWGRELPLITAGTLLLSGTLAATVVLSKTEQTRVAAVLLTVLLVLMLAVGAREPGRIETRYTFFLYPLILALNFTAITSLVESRTGGSQTALAAGAFLSLLFFWLTKDFQPRHIAKIATREINFRIGMNAKDASQYYPRADYRQAGVWLAQHAHRGDAVIIGIPSIDQYYRANFVFLPDDDERYEDYACSLAGSVVDRWTNLPFVYGTDALAAKAATGQRIFLVLYPDQAPIMLAAGARLSWRQSSAWISPDNGIVVTVINP